MVEKVINIIKNQTDLEFGFCYFSEVENELINCRAKALIPENAKIIISFLFPYKCEEEKPLNISRYAAVKDYHIVCGKILEKLCEKLKNDFPENNFVYFVDNSPIPEVKAAVLSGLGVKGKNNLLINKKYGSFVFLGEIITDLPLTFHPTKFSECINCQKCVNACPTGFLKDKNLPCLSDITQKKKELSKEEENQIAQSGIIWGCDICQEVCPLNENKKVTSIKEFKKEYRKEFTLEEDKKDRAYIWRGPKVIERNYEILSKSKQS